MENDFTPQEYDKYGESFLAYWEEYCEDNCPTEGYEDAMNATFALWKTFNPRKANTTKTIFTKVEVENLKEFVKENKADLVRVEITETGIGSAISVSTLDGSVQKNITDYTNW